MRKTNYFELRTPTTRNSIPHAVELMNGADEVSYETADGSFVLEVFERTTARFVGELAAYDGIPVPLGLHGEGEEWDVVFASMKGDGFTGFGVKRKGSTPTTAVSCGELSVDSGTIAITTLEQVAADGAPEYTMRRPWVRKGSVGDSVCIGNGYGDGGEDIIALLDAEGELCGVFVGGLFESRGWEGRILPGENILTADDLVEIVDEARGQVPVLVENEAGEVIGYLTNNWCFVGTPLTLTMSTDPRPDEPVTEEN